MVKLVREKYLTQAKTENKAQLQSFLSELYVFLTDQMHAGLDKVKTRTIVLIVTCMYKYSQGGALEKNAQNKLFVRGRVCLIYMTCSRNFLLENISNVFVPAKTTPYIYTIHYM